MTTLEKWRAPESYRSHPRIGYIHVPGSAGSALSEAISKSFSIRYLPVHRILQLDNLSEFQSDSPYTFTMAIPTGLSREMLLSQTLLSGHLSVGQMQSLWRNYMFSCISDPRFGLIKLFAHHADPGISFVSWLRGRISFKSSILTLYTGHLPIPSHDSYETFHARPYSEPVATDWAFDSRFVERLIRPLDHIFLSNDPQLTLNWLVERGVIPKWIAVSKVNANARPNQAIRELNWGSLDEAASTLIEVTRNDLRLLEFLSNAMAHKCVAFEVPAGDIQVEEFLKTKIENS